MLLQMPSQPPQLNRVTSTQVEQAGPGPGRGRRGGGMWLWRSKPFWDPILGVFGAPPILGFSLVGILWLVGEFTTHFRTYLSGWIGMVTGGTIWILTHGHMGGSSSFLGRSPQNRGVPFGFPLAQKGAPTKGMRRVDGREIYARRQLRNHG